MKHLSADLQFPVFLAGLRLFLQPLPKQLSSPLNEFLALAAPFTLRLSNI